MMTIKEETEIPKKKRYLQRYNKTWETNAKYCDWLASSSRGVYFAFCTACNVDLSLNAGVTDLSKHATSKKHIKCISALPQRSVDENVAYVSDIMSDHFYDETKRGSKTAYEGRDKKDADRNNLGSFSAVQGGIKRHCPAKSRSCVNEIHNCYASCSDQEDELDIFGKHVTAQLRKLPEEYSVGLILDIQNLITQKRLKAIAEQNAQSAEFT